MSPESLFLSLYFSVYVELTLEQQWGAPVSALHICDSATSGLTSLRLCGTIVHSSYLLKKNLSISGPVQFKSVVQGSAVFMFNVYFL